MSVLIYAKTFYPNLGGMEVSAHLLARELAELGQPVTVITGTPLPPDTAELSTDYRVIRSETPQTLWKAIRQSRVVIIRGGLSAKAGLLSLLAGRRIICFHEMAGPLKAPFEGLPKRPRAALVNLARWIVAQRTSLHVGVSRAVLEAKRLPESIPTEVLYNPVDDPLWPDTPRSYDERSLDLLYAGRVRADKGIFVLARALEATVSADQPVTLGVAGDGPDRPRLQAQLERIEGLSVRYFGIQRGAELSALYAQARWVIVPSAGHREGMGMVAAEAMAHGTPAIVSAQPALVETIGPAGIHFPVSNHIALAELLQTRLRNRAMWELLASEAWRVREAYGLGPYREKLRQWSASSLL
jgi:glycosyltransferase involved in cell wall biosynthesis